MKIRIIILMLIMASCTKVHDGIIVEKHIIPESSIMVPTFHHVGKSSYTTFHSERLEERFCLTIKHTDNQNFDTVIKVFNVSPEVYESKNVGDYYSELQAKKIKSKDVKKWKN